MKIYALCNIRLESVNLCNNVKTLLHRLLWELGLEVIALNGKKYNRDPKKRTIKELTGDETTMSIGDKKEDELKKVGINLRTFKARKFVG